MSKRLTQEEFLEKFYSIYSEDDFEVISEYINTRTEITIRCKHCGKTYQKTPQNLLSTYTNFACECIKPLGSWKILSPEVFADRFFSKYSEEDFEIISNYVNAKTPISIRCKHCGKVHNKMTNTLFYDGYNFVCDCQRGWSLRTTHEEFCKKFFLKYSKDNYEIVSEYVNNKTLITIKCKHCGKIYYKKPSELLRKRANFACDCIRINTGQFQQITHKQFCKEFDELYGNEFSIVSEYTGLKNKISIKHNKCGNVFEKLAGNVRHKNAVLRCPCEISSGTRTTFDKNVNSIAVLMPEIAKLFANQEESWEYSCHSAKRTDFICPICGRVHKNKLIYSVCEHGLRCPCSSDKLSLSEKIMYTILKMNIDKLDGNTFIYDETTEWSCNKRYDFRFFINGVEYIIETHGLQHYCESKRFGRSLQEEQDNDLFKLNNAISHGIKKDNYIIIDCRRSDFSFIKTSILNSRLKHILCLDNFDWEECAVESAQSILITACENYKNGKSISSIAEETKLHPGTITKYLHIGTKLGLCEFVDSHKKSVRCKNNNVIYKSIKDALEEFGLNRHYLITDVCNGKMNYCINPNNNEKLYWEWVS